MSGPIHVEGVGDIEGDDKAEIVERLEEILRLAKSGNITGIVVFTHHEGIPEGQSFSVAGLRHFNVPALATMAHTLFGRLCEAWFDHEVEGGDSLSPRLGVIDDPDDGS
jgi:hypothetical protein